MKNIYSTIFCSLIVSKFGGLSSFEMAHSIKRGRRRPKLENGQFVTTYAHGIDEVTLFSVAITENNRLFREIAQTIMPIDSFYFLLRYVDIISYKKETIILTFFQCKEKSLSKNRCV